MKKYEWAVIGGGIAGISIAEILTRQGHSCVLVEKNESLASETTREFHEWLHTGALYTLIPGRLKTIKFILGAIDDLMEYYSSYTGMNLQATEAGLNIEKLYDGWFQENYIHFKFRIGGRKLTFPWVFGAARAILLIEKIKEHDWLRRRAGEIDPFKQGRIKMIPKVMLDLFKYADKFMDIQTSDITINSRYLLRDMVATSVFNGLELSLSNKIKKIEKRGVGNLLVGEESEIYAEKVVFCNGHSIRQFCDVETKTSYAPIAVVSGISPAAKSFVELDYFPQNCINLLTKERDIGMVGGISFSKKEKCDPYLDFVLREHKKLEPNMKEICRYNGIKTEIIFKNEPRGYLYHIVNLNDNIWAIVPGKFTLAFSMAPEFYRRVYKKNPKKYFQTKKAEKESKYNVSETVWKDQMLHKKNV